MDLAGTADTVDMADTAVDNKTLNERINIPI